jgi:hypothetical protein
VAVAPRLPRRLDIAMPAAQQVAQLRECPPQCTTDGLGLQAAPAQHENLDLAQVFLIDAARFVVRGQTPAVGIVEALRLEMQCVHGDFFSFGS